MDIMKAKRESKKRSGTEMLLIPLNKADENSSWVSPALPPIQSKYDLTDNIATLD